MSETPIDTRRLLLDTDALRLWDTGIIQRFPQPQRVEVTGLEPRGAGSCDARVATIYGSVLRENGRLRMWYGMMPDAHSHSENPDHFYTGYAESDDGVTWRRSDLRITGQKMYPGNNIVPLPGVTMGVVPALPGSTFKYLAAVLHAGLEPDLFDKFGYTYRGGGTHLFGSTDGFHWRQLTETAVAAQGDVACLYVDPPSGRYLLYQKVGLMHGLDARRSFICMTSTDGVNRDGYEGMGSWRECFVADDYDDMQSQLSGFRIADHYGLAIYRAGALYVAVESIFQIGDPLRRVFAQNPGGLAIFRLAYSHNGFNWRHPRGRPVWMSCSPPGQIDSGFLVPASTFLEHNDELLLYYGGSRYDHGWCIHEDFSMRADVPLAAQRDSARIGLAKIRKDRFASLSATYRGRFDVDAGLRQGEELFVNVLCPPQGSVRVAIAERGAEENLRDFDFADCVPVTGDHTRAVVRFRDAQVASIPLDKRLFLRFELSCGEIFGYEWGAAV
jgi:hypothetical protein